MAKKIHGRRMRYIPRGNERNRKSRLKTFNKEEDAKRYAEGLGLGKFKVVRTKYGLGRKFKIVSAD